MSERKELLELAAKVDAEAVEQTKCALAQTDWRCAFDHAEMAAKLFSIASAVRARALPERVKAETRRAIAADPDLSLRECARKHGVGVGVVRGVRSLAKDSTSGS